MDVLFRGLARPLLFGLSAGDPERAHDLVIAELERASRHPSLLRAIRIATGHRRRTGSRTVMGLTFPGPVGLAAGFDKNGRALPALAAMGFGFLEAGTVTCHGQAGNPRPRIHRFAGEEALVNSMGFPNDGVEAIAARHDARPLRLPVPVGWNVGKSKVTPLEDAADDYIASIRRLHRHADYLAVNVSSPNTPGLRHLEERRPLEALLRGVIAETARLDAAEHRPRPTPVALKISPDLNDAQLDDVVEIAAARGVAAIIATNTTLRRDGLPDGSRGLPGGMSGRPLAARSLEVVSHLVRRLDGRIPVIGAGGVMDEDSAARMLDAGAGLVQLYTGFIYGGPKLPGRIDAALRERWLRGA